MHLNLKIARKKTLHTSHKMGKTQPSYNGTAEVQDPFYEELKRLQETPLKKKKSNDYYLKGCDIYDKTNTSIVDNRPTGGLSILVKRRKKTTPHEIFPLNTELQANTVRITLHCTITICSIYIPLKQKFNRAAIYNFY